MTNAQKIRDFTDYELAEFICSYHCEHCANYIIGNHEFGECGEPRDCIAGTLAWLERKAEED